MKPFIDSQELASRFNEDEAVWRHYERLCQLRRRFGLGITLPRDLLDQLDWLEAEREGRIIRCIGMVLS